MYLTQLYPTPKTLEAKQGEPLSFGSTCRVVYPKIHPTRSSKM